MREQKRFSFERLEVYQVARQVLASVLRDRARFRGMPGELAPQLERALVSVVLNIAEGAGRFTHADQRRHYQIACGSATEAAACLDIAGLHGRSVEPLRADLQRVVAMLLALVRR